MLQYGQQRTASVTPVLSGDRTLHCTPIPAAPRTVPLCTQQLSPGAPSPCYAPWLLSLMRSLMCRESTPLFVVWALARYSPTEQLLHSQYEKAKGRKYAGEYRKERKSLF